MHSAAVYPKLYLILFVGSDTLLLVETNQVRSEGCSGVLVVNFVQRMTLVLVGSPLATPYQQHNAF